MNDIVESQKKRVKRIHAAVMAILAVLLVLTFFLNMNTGYIKLSPQDTLRTLLGGGSEKENLILFDFRLPRIVIALLVGAGFSVSGCIIQGITKNPLSDPGLLGINSGAGFMVILYLLFFNAKSMFSIFTLPFLALMGSGLTAVLVYMLSRKKGGGILPVRLVLTGVAVQAGISAATTLLVVKLDDTQYDFVAAWQAGSIWGSNWKFVMSLLPWMVILIPYALSKARSLDILNLGDETACGLGVDVNGERKKLLAVSVGLAASCVAVSGSISFVGLVAPHLARKLVGPGHRILLPASVFTGALLVSAADMASRVLFQPKEIPTGIMVSIIGAPYFLYLFSRQKNKV